MEQRVSLLTLGTRNMDAQAAFYEALGWQRVDSPDGVIAFDLLGQTLGLYPIAALADDIGVGVDTMRHGALTLGHNVASKAEVDSVMARAKGAGARILKSAQDVFWGGYHGYFADPEGHIWEIAWNPHSPLGKDGAFQWNGAG